VTLSDAATFAGNAGAIGVLTSILVWVGSYTAPSLAGETRNGQNARKKAHVFRLCCKIPIINLSELVRGFAIMKAGAVVQGATGATNPCVNGCFDLETSECIK
jgi:hypothetical protein